MKRDYFLTIFGVFRHLIPCYKRTKNTCLMAALACGIIVCSSLCVQPYMSL